MNEPLKIRTPIIISIIPEIICVYFRILALRLNTPSSVEAKKATKINGRINPKQYTNTKRILIIPVWLEAYKKTLAKIGPIQGVQEKLKVNPIRNARNGVVLLPFRFTLFFAENSCFKKPILKTPN